MKKERLARDLISDLPDNVTEKILKCLPLPDAVRTCLLSREWRYKWKSLPSLVFYENVLNFSKEHDVHRVISRVLLAHEGPVKKFLVVFIQPANSSELSLWFNFLSKQHVQKLVLHFKCAPYGGLIPYNLYALSELRYLSFEHCELRLPSLFEGFGSLVTLELWDVDILFLDLGCLISKSPLLENVIVCAWSCNGDLEIDAPRLKSFQYYGGGTSIHFLNAPLLSKVTIESGNFQYQVQDVKSVISFGKSASITHLKLLSEAFQSTALSCVSQNLVYNVNHLKILEFHVFRFEDVEVNHAFCLISNAPNLERLKIYVWKHCSSDQFTTAQFLKKQRKCGAISLGCLKQVKICLEQCSESCMELVKLLLSAATVLEKFNIYSSSADKLPLSEKLLKFPRASPKAEIEIH